MASTTPVCTDELVTLDAPAPASKDELFTRMVAQLRAVGRVSDEAAFREALEEREAIGSTYMGDAIAIPHGKSATVGHPSVCVWRLATPLPYESHGESGPVTRVFMLAMPDSAGDEHLRTLAAVARLLAHDDVRLALDRATDPGTVVSLLTEQLEHS